MRRVTCLTKGVQFQAGILACAESQTAACPINAAARLFSSAASTAHFSPIAQFDNNTRHSRQSQFVLPQQQLTSLLSFPHARSFSSGDNDDFSGHVEAADSIPAFDPSAVLDAVVGAEEDTWLSAREDVWFFNRYMQSVLRFAQDATGLPW